jgi:hypothetical protein
MEEPAGQITVNVQPPAVPVPDPESDLAMVVATALRFNPTDVAQAMATSADARREIERLSDWIDRIYAVYDATRS